MKRLTFLLVILTVVLAACSPALDQPAEGAETVPDTDQQPSDESEPVAEEGIDSEILDITWLWERFDDTADLNNITVEDPELYTLQFKPDGTYQVKADCNLASGEYTLDGSSITLSAGPMTLAACEPESLSDTYLTRLNEVVTFVIVDGQLVLNLWADGGNLVFTPAE